MNQRRFAVFMVLLLCLLPITASANSSWQWISETRPLDVLPVVAIITIAVEVVALWLLLGKTHLIKITVIVTIANLLSFAAPYLDVYFEIFEIRLYPFWQTLEHSPYYTVCIIYLVMTLAVELPVTYFAIRKYVKSNWRFLLTAVGANIVTTIITAAAERIFCYGRW